MWDYSKKVMDHFLNPRNVGEIEKPDAVGEVGNLRCGDALKLYLRLDDSKERIEEAKFQTFGCASAIASASALTELAAGKTVDQAAELTNDDIAEYLGSLPEEKMHCSVMGMEALQAAIKKLRGESPGVATVGDDGGEYDPEGLDRTVCYCFSVTERKIREVIAANHLENVEEVIHYTKAGGGCGGCKPDIQKLLDEMKGEREEKARQQAQSEEGGGKRKLTNLQKISLIQKTIDEQIAPGLRADGGDIELIDIDGDRVVVKLQGACASCPSAHITLKRWVEAKLRELVDENLTVEEELEG